MSHIEVIGRGLLVRDGAVLLCQNLEHGYWYLPGGHVEFGEAAAEAVRREFEEETGLAVRVGECLLVQEGSFKAKKHHHELNLVFHVEPTGEVGEVASRESGIAFRWVDLAAVPDLDVRPTAIKAWLASGGAPHCGWVSEFHVKL